MIKINDIAKATGYSITTVSKAFNGYSDISEFAKNTIIETANRLGYVPNGNARGLATKKSHTIGIIFDEILGMGIRHPFFGSVIEYFKEGAEKEGYDILFISSSIGKSNIKSYLDHCRQRAVDGVFIASTHYEDQMVQDLLKSDIPCVCVEVEAENIISVLSDDFQGSYDATQYLARLGHQKIAHISGGTNTYAGMRRQAGYLKAMEDLQLAVGEHAIQVGEYFSWDNGYQAMKKLMQLDPRPTGIVVAGDMMALGAVKAAVEQGFKVPEDFSIIGFDNIDMLNYTLPGITTIGQDAVQLGLKAAAYLVDVMNDRPLPKKTHVIPTQLVVRESCRRI